MFRPLVILTATGAVLFGATSIAGGAQSASNTPRTSQATLVAVLGPSVAVPAGQFRKAYAFCPNGYYVTGGGAYNGAITEIASSPTPNLRGWFVDGTNNDPLKRTFHHRADAICMKGNAPITGIRPAGDSSPLRQLEVEAAASRDITGRR
jgi:hypothetical protein